MKFLILLSLINFSYAVSPLICQSEHCRTVFRDPTPRCPELRISSDQEAESKVVTFLDQILRNMPAQLIYVKL